MAKEDIELEIMNLEDKYKATRNPVEKADISSKIANLKKELANTDPVKSESILQKDVPVRADHDDSKGKRVPRQITDNGNTFTTLI